MKEKKEEKRKGKGEGKKKKGGEKGGKKGGGGDRVKKKVTWRNLNPLIHKREFFI